jgi:signal transduction histidine kinase
MAEQARVGMMDRLRAAFLGNAKFSAVDEELQQLVDRRFTQLAEVIEMRNNGKFLDAVSTIAGKTGQKTMEAIRARIGEIRDADQELLSSLRTSEGRDVKVLRLTTGGGAALNIVLVLTAGLLLSRDMRRRTLGVQQLARHNESLESLVNERTAELRALSSHLQDVTEHERSALARELHDELGGLLVAAKMDVSWLQSHRADHVAAAGRWARLNSVLDAGVDLKRRLVEQLRPSLLDNMGLLSALQWQFQESCGTGGLHCTQELPEEEMNLQGEAAIAIFRIAQEAMTNLLKHAKATSAHLGVRLSETEFIMTIRDNGSGLPAGAIGRSHGLTGMRHRAETLGGSWRAGRNPDGSGTEVEVRLPLSRIKAGIN